jgi:hypothetical protein
MSSRISSKLTYANVVATLALFLVVAGGTALASYVVSSNKEVGPGTISGHKPPAGDHSNIIAGSVTAADLASGAVTNGKIQGGSLTGSDLASGTITGSNLNIASVLSTLKIHRYFAVQSPGDLPIAFATIGPWTLSGHCFDDGGGSFHATVDVSAGGSFPVLLATNANGLSAERFTTGARPVDVSASSSSTQLALASFVAGSGLRNDLAGQVLASVDFSNDVAGFNPPECVYMFNGGGS